MGGSGELRPRGRWRGGCRLVGVGGLDAGAVSAEIEAAGTQGGSALSIGSRLGPIEVEEGRGHVPDAGGWRYGASWWMEVREGRQSPRREAPAEAWERRQG